MVETMEKMTETAFGREMVIGKKELKPFVGRTNWHGLLNFSVHMALLAAAGALTAISWGTLWVVPAMLAYALIMAFLFNPVHECSHGTAFRNRRLNEAVYWIVCLIYMVPPTMFRYEHATHHTYTQIRGRDPDMMPKNMTVGFYLWFAAGGLFWLRGVKWFFLQPFGIIEPAQRYFLPDSEIPRVVREARIIMVVYGSIAALSFWFGSWAAVIYWILPRLIGEPSMRLVRVAEHGECEEGPDLRVNTRTTKASSVLRFLFWNMPYHAEHHIAPMVPFHALGRLHDQIGDRLFPVGENYPAVHAEVLGKISRRDGVTWARDTRPAE